jgi:hypothetical protein
LLLLAVLLEIDPAARVHALGAGENVTNARLRGWRLHLNGNPEERREQRRASEGAAAAAKDELMLLLLLLATAWRLTGGHGYDG